jgi:hypothetical protein
LTFAHHNQHPAAIGIKPLLNKSTIRHHLLLGFAEQCQSVAGEPGAKSGVTENKLANQQINKQQ